MRESCTEDFEQLWVKLRSEARGGLPPGPSTEREKWTWWEPIRTECEQLDFAPSGASSESSLRPWLARTKPTGLLESPSPLAGEVWTRMQRIRTLAEVEFDFPVFTETLFKYQELSEKAKKLRLLGMSLREIGKRLCVDYKVIQKALLNNNLN